MQNSVTITITAGTPVPVIPSWISTKAKSIIITPLHGGTGVIYVLCVPLTPGTAPGGAVGSKSAQTLITELAPATSTVPGGTFVRDRSMDGQVPIEVAEFQIDGSHNGDTVQVSWELP